ncbi:hypothetical protein OS493_039007, partial [Desmophyllum pertusum]
RFPPPPAVKALLSVTKETARSKNSKNRRTLAFIVDEINGGLVLRLTGLEVDSSVLDDQAKLRDL